VALRRFPSIHTALADPIIYAVVDRATDKLDERGEKWIIARARPEIGVVELELVPDSQRTQNARATTEAFYLLARQILGTLHYRRLEWRCDNLNGESKKEAR